MIGFQVVLRAEDDRVLAPDAARRRAFAMTVRRIGRTHGLYTFGLADTHGHAGLIADAASTGRFVHDVRPALAAALGVRMAPASLRPLQDTWHAESLVRYAHRQDEHHGSRLDPLREATSLHELLGLRPGGLWMADRVRAVAPRVTRAKLLEQWGIGELVEAFDLDTLADSGAAAIGCARLEGRSAEVVAARLACVHAGDASTAELARVLGVDPRTVRALRGQVPDPRLVTAIRLHMGIRAVVGRPALAFSPPRPRYTAAQCAHAGMLPA